MLHFTMKRLPHKPGLLRARDRLFNRGASIGHTLRPLRH